MAAVTRDQGIGRRLPRWLLGSKSDGPDKHDKLDAEKIVTEKIQTERHKEAVLVQSKDSHLVVDCDIKNGSRRKSRKQKRGDKKSGKIGESEERRDELESEARKRKRPKNSSLERKEEVKTRSPSNGEVDLTVDDLLLIAKEYVDDNMDIKHQQPLKEDKEFIKSMLLKTELSKNESESCVDHLKTSSSLSAHKPELSCDSNTCSRGKSSVDIRETGDPAQEMLDLFLGPLLKRPIEEKKDMEFTFKLERQRPRQNSNGGTEELITLGKKKGSLKDKVAIFLN